MGAGKGRQSWLEWTSLPAQRNGSLEITFYLEKQKKRDISPTRVLDESKGLPPRTCQSFPSAEICLPPPAALASAAQSGGEDRLWEAKLVTFSSLRRGVPLAQLAACRKGQAVDPAFPRWWGQVGGQERTLHLRELGSFHVADTSISPV